MCERVCAQRAGERRARVSPARGLRAGGYCSSSRGGAQGVVNSRARAPAYFFRKLPLGAAVFLQANDIRRPRYFCLSLFSSSPARGPPSFSRSTLRQPGLKNSGDADERGGEIHLSEKRAAPNVLKVRARRN